jgi:hypothetical protein
VTVTIEGVEIYPMTPDVMGVLKPGDIVTYVYVNGSLPCGSPDYNDESSMARHVGIVGELLHFAHGTRLQVRVIAVGLVALEDREYVVTLSGERMCSARVLVPRGPA